MQVFGGELEKLAALVFQRMRWPDPIEWFYDQLPPDSERVLEAASIQDVEKFCRRVGDLRWAGSSDMMWHDYTSWLPEYVDLCCFYYWLRPDPACRLDEFVQLTIECTKRSSDSDLIVSCHEMLFGATAVSRFYYEVSLFRSVDQLVRSCLNMGASLPYITARVDFTDNPALLEDYIAWARALDMSDSAHEYSAEDLLSNELVWSRFHGFPPHITCFSLEYPGPLRVADRAEWMKLLVPVRKR